MAAKILVVDDTPMNVKLLADLLAAKGYATVTAASGAEALAKLEAEKPDLVLLDVMMPGMSGYEVCRRSAPTRRTACCRSCWSPRSTRRRSASRASRPAPTIS